MPATTLAALAASTCFVNSVIVENIIDAFPCEATQAGMQDNIRGITVGQPAGCSTAMVKVTDDLPTSILMTRTARLIMEGSILVDPKIRDPDIYNRLHSSSGDPVLQRALAHHSRVSQ